ncbi:hypothetical protein [Actinomyces qiguomingii]|uniref:hypothetical protein n=1 Tax=Actinomyces qiguomingii TaxID=2057800 RepID=UPI000CA05DCA|nr:hypothetical protein [Actinomyces qiguomingii]
MKRLPRMVTVVATTLTAVALTASISACSSNSDDSEDRNADQEVTAGTDSDAGTDADADADSDADSDDAAKSEPTVPDGYTLTEVPDADLSLAVPSDWSTVTGAEISSQTELVDAIATTTGRTSEEVRTAMESLALWSMDTSGTKDYDENLNVELVEQRYAVPTEDEMAQVLENQANASANTTMTPDSYTTTTTASGDDAVLQSYTLQIGDNTTKGAYVVVPAKGGDAYALIAISTATAERTRELADVVLASL